jgi:hypothetical protein
MHSGLMEKGRTKPPMRNGMQNQVRFLISRQVCANVRMAIQMAAMTPPTREGVYGQSTYLGAASDIVVK